MLTFAEHILEPDREDPELRRIGRRLEALVKESRSYLASDRFHAKRKRDFAHTVATFAYRNATYCLVRIGGRVRKRLSRRQKVVMRLARGGLTDKQIAKELDLARSSVSTHLMRIYTKLAIKSRVELTLHSLMWT